MNLHRGQVVIYEHAGTAGEGIVRTLYRRVVRLQVGHVRLTLPVARVHSDDSLGSQFFRAEKESHGLNP